MTYDPMLTSIATEVVAKTVVETAQRTLAPLVRFVRDRLGRDKRAAEALAAAERDQASQRALDHLIAELSRIVGEDQAFARELSSRWKAYTDQSASANTISGNVGGHAVQARDISGGLSLGNVDREDSGR